MSGTATNGGQRSLGLETYLDLDTGSRSKDMAVDFGDGTSSPRPCFPNECFDRFRVCVAGGLVILRVVSKGNKRFITRLCRPKRVQEALSVIHPTILNFNIYFSKYPQMGLLAADFVRNGSCQFSRGNQ